VERFSHSACFASLATAMPDFVRSFPSAQLTDTAVHEQLVSTWRHVRQQGVGATTPAAANRFSARAPAAAAAATAIAAEPPAAVVPIAAAVAPSSTQSRSRRRAAGLPAMYTRTKWQQRLQQQLQLLDLLPSLRRHLHLELLSSAATLPSTPPRLACTLCGGDEVVDRLWRHAQAYAAMGGRSERGLIPTRRAATIRGDSADRGAAVQATPCASRCVPPHATDLADGAS